MMLIWAVWSDLGFMDIYGDSSMMIEVCIYMYYSISMYFIKGDQPPDIAGEQVLAHLHLAIIHGPHPKRVDTPQNCRKNPWFPALL